MTNQICTDCLTDKPLSEFYLYKKTGKYRTQCKNCCSLAAHERFLNNKLNNNISQKKCSHCQKLKAISEFSVSQAMCKECKKTKAKEWRTQNPTTYRITTKEYEARIKFLNTEVYQNIRLRSCLRSRIREALKNNFKKTSTLTLLGCSIPQFKNYLKSKFKKGMTWNNYGEWHIDHIKPCSSFNLLSLEEQKICFHYTNLQPLWAIENLSKGKTPPDTHQGAHQQGYDTFTDLPCR